MTRFMKQWDTTNEGDEESANHTQTNRKQPHQYITHVAQKMVSREEMYPKRQGRLEQDMNVARQLNQTH